MVASAASSLTRTCMFPRGAHPRPRQVKFRSAPDLVVSRRVPTAGGAGIATSVGADRATEGNVGRGRAAVNALAVA